MVMLKNTREPERAGPVQVAFYIRVSTEEQNLDLQKQALAQNTRPDEAETPRNGEEHGTPRKS